MLFLALTNLIFSILTTEIDSLQVNGTIKMENTTDWSSVSSGDVVLFTFTSKIDLTYDSENFLILIDGDTVEARFGQKNFYNDTSIESVDWTLSDEDGSTTITKNTTTVPFEEHLKPMSIIDDVQPVFILNFTLGIKSGLWSLTGKHRMTIRDDVSPGSLVRCIMTFLSSSSPYNVTSRTLTSNYQVVPHAEVTVENRSRLTQPIMGIFSTYVTLNSGRDLIDSTVECFTPPEMSSKETGRAGRQTGRAGRQTGRAGRQTGRAGRQTGRAGRQTGRAGRQTGRAGRQTGRAGRQTGRAGRQTGRAGRQTGQHRDRLDVLGDRLDVLGDRLDVLGDRLDVLGDRLDVLGDRLDVLGDRLDVLGDRLDVLGDRLDVLGDRLDVLGDRLDVLGDRLDVLGDRLDVLGDRLDVLGDRLDVLGDRLDVLGDRLDVLGDRLDSMETDWTAWRQTGQHGDRLDVLGDRLDVLGDRLDVLGDRLDVLGDRLDVLGDRLDSMETDWTAWRQTGQHGDRLDSMETDWTAWRQTGQHGDRL
ncbi:hypothetical protein Bpfe_008113 [Biomphalaria pfeifferi]|uniref:Uncharacterized protein n=1 Tax=Biomphalaria pfeifferi TaxID=112525 RepID=A0AAD8BX50_BIOPF|nr:hypothetical protein Bpfe_008113 [Biomphalaria pfeifferi]